MWTKGSDSKRNRKIHQGSPVLASSAHRMSHTSACPVPLWLNILKTHTYSKRKREVWVSWFLAFPASFFFQDPQWALPSDLMWLLGVPQTIPANVYMGVPSQHVPVSPSSHLSPTLPRKPFLVSLRPVIFKQEWFYLSRGYLAMSGRVGEGIFVNCHK